MKARFLYAFTPAFVGAVFGASVGPSAFADVIYSNGTPSQNNLYNINNYNNFYYQVTSSFSVAQSSTATGVTFSEWSLNQLTTSLSWAITTSAFGGTVIASGMASDLTNTDATALGSWTITETSFSLPDVSLAAGDYWLQLGAGNGSSETAWGTAIGGSSTSEQQSVSNGTPQSPGSILSESFSITGSATDVPEPASIAVFATGLFGAALVRHRRRHVSDLTDR
jgi:hypothetical protein